MCKSPRINDTNNYDPRRETGIDKRWKIREKPLFLLHMRMQVRIEMVITVSKATEDGHGVWL